MARIPLNVGYSPRDVSQWKDERRVNMLVVPGGSGQIFTTKRPGTDDSGLNTGGGTGNTGRGLFAADGKVFAVTDGTLWFEGDSYGLGGSGSSKFDFVQMEGDTADGVKVFFKSTSAGYTFAVDGTILSSITHADYPVTTVPGLVYIDSTYYVATVDGNIFGSELSDPLTWSALNVIKANFAPDKLVGIAKVLNYLVALGSYTIEFFYDAGNAVGSPLARMDNAMIKLGCASGASIANLETTIIFMGVTQSQTRAIYILDGTTPTQISTPYVDKILANDSLVDLMATSLRTLGNNLYILTLPDTGITLVWEQTGGLWSEWNGASYPMGE